MTKPAPRDNPTIPPVRATGGGFAFTLIELLVVITIFGILAALLTSAVSRGMESARATQCAAQMKQLGVASSLYAADHDDRFPRSQHSAFAHGEIPWERTLAAHLGSSSAQWQKLLRGVYRCPSDKRRNPLSYGLNVYFELGPEDDYTGAPTTWRRYSDVLAPADVILFAEAGSPADHIMPHFWSSPKDADDVDHQRHAGQSVYVLVDGHTEKLPLSGVYAADPPVDRWNPSLAR